jgi:mRNA interferase RelE/StbE
VPTYRAEFTTKARKEIDALDSTVRRRVVAAIVELEANPCHAGVRKLQGVEGFKIRIGGYRVLFTVDHGRLLVVVFRAARRDHVYDR